MSQLSIVSFGSIPHYNSLCGSINKLGYAANVIAAEDWINTEYGQNSNKFILFFGQEAKYQQIVMERIGATARWSPLGIFHEKSPALESGLQNWFADFIVWPCHFTELKLRLARVGALLDERRENSEDSVLIDEFMSLGLVGNSSVFRKFLKLIKIIAPFPAPVIIQGETGTGKELAARAIHYLSPRRNKPFIPINCGAIPDNLLENELYGHEAGAFTDARHEQTGLVAQAHGGTLFLDEIETLSQRAQIVLLRFLEYQEYKPLGSTQLKRADVRIVVASNEILEKLVQEKRFRQDLFFRLDVLSVSIPALRERAEDIEVLARHFHQIYSAKYQIPPKPLDARTLAGMQKHNWPGNVRELANFIQRLLLTGAGTFPETPDNRSNHNRRRLASDRRKILVSQESLQESKSRVIEEFEKRYLSQLMHVCQGNVTHAARKARTERSMLGKLLKKHGIDRDRYLP